MRGNALRLLRRHPGGFEPIRELQRVEGDGHDDSAILHSARAWGVIKLPVEPSVSRPGAGWAMDIDGERSHPTEVERFLPRCLRGERAICSTRFHLPRSGIAGAG